MIFYIISKKMSQSKGGHLWHAIVYTLQSDEKLTVPQVQDDKDASLSTSGNLILDSVIKQKKKKKKYIHPKQKEVQFSSCFVMIL